MGEGDPSLWEQKQVEEGMTGRPGLVVDPLGYLRIWRTWGKEKKKWDKGTYSLVSPRAAKNELNLLAAVIFLG